MECRLEHGLGLRLGLGLTICKSQAICRLCVCRLRQLDVCSYTNCKGSAIDSDVDVLHVIPGDEIDAWNGRACSE